MIIDYYKCYANILNDNQDNFTSFISVMQVF